jgi:putative drug exporter of the RND superfamily
MFAAIARFTTKYRIAIIIVWLAAAIGLFLTSPSLSEVGVTDESQFLPQDTESATAARLLSEKFVSPAESSDNGGIIVIYNATGLKDDDFIKASAIHDWLTSDSAPVEIGSVTSIFENDNLRPRLISQDQTAMMIVLDFSTPSLSNDTREAISLIRSHLSQNYPDSDIHLTGGSALFQDMLSSVEQTVNRTTIVTVILVVILLLLIYRSPVAILLPLVAIGASFAAATGILGYLASAGVKFSTLAEAYLVVIIFGVGTDYCLFIVSRYREELRTLESRPALAQSLIHIGPVITASALTVIVAFLSLGISNFGLNQTTGYAMAVGVAVTLLAGLTLVPALMSLTGKLLFWPARSSVARLRSSSLWQTIGAWVSRRPVLVAVPIIAVLLVPYLALPDLARSADIIDQLP